MVTYVTHQDIDFLYSCGHNTAGTSQRNEEPTLSLGGLISFEDRILSGVHNNLWFDYSVAESISGITKYRCLYIINNNRDYTYTNVRVWKGGGTPSYSSAFAMGLGTAAISATEQVIANENTAPTSVVFSNPSDYASGLVIGNLTPGQYKAVWIKISLNSSAAAYPNDFIKVAVQGEDGRSSGGPVYIMKENLQTWHIGGIDGSGLPAKSMKTDAFDVKEILQTTQQTTAQIPWYMDKQNLLRDPRVLIKRGIITKRNQPGIFRINDNELASGGTHLQVSRVNPSKEPFQMYIQSSDGYNNDTVKERAVNANELPNFGQLNTIKDWRNTENTVYIRISGSHDNENSIFSMGVRGGFEDDENEQIDTMPEIRCQGMRYRFNVSYSGYPSFTKQYVFSNKPTPHTTDTIIPSTNFTLPSLANRWVGFKFISYEKVISSTRKVVNQVWVDEIGGVSTDDAATTNQDWRKWFEVIDDGTVFNSSPVWEGDCHGTSANQIFAFGGPVVDFQFDSVNGADLKWASVREVQVPTGFDDIVLDPAASMMLGDLTPRDIYLFYSGGSSNAAGNASLGGAISKHRIVSGGNNNLFDEVYYFESIGGKTEYRCVYVKNMDQQNSGGVGGIPLSNTKVYLERNTESNDDTVLLGLGKAGRNGTEQTIADETKTPSGVSFKDPSSIESALNMGTLNSGDRYPLWIKRIVNKGAGDFKDNNFILRIQGGLQQQGATPGGGPTSGGGGTGGTGSTPPPSGTIKKFTIEPSRVRANGQTNDKKPQNAVDGNTGTYWENKNIGCWIQFDLGKLKWIETIKFRFKNGDNIQYTFRLWISEDGVIWKNMGNTSTLKNTDLQLVNKLEFNGRFIRLEFITISDDNTVQLTEFEAHGKDNISTESILKPESQRNGVAVGDFEFDGGPLLKNAKVYVVFWGDWNNQDPSRSQVENKIKAMLNSKTYFKKLNQYKGVQKPAWGGSFVSNRNYTTPFTWENIIGTAVDLVLDGKFPDPFENKNEYCIMFIPRFNSSGPAGARGAHGFFKIDRQQDGRTIDSTNVAVGYCVNKNTNGGSFRMKDITQVMSHEIIEAITDPYANGINSAKENCTPGYSGAICEIVDVCHILFGDTDTGTNVEAYWSNDDDKCVLPTS